MNNEKELFLIVAYAIFFLVVFLVSILIFIIKSRKDRLKIEEKKKEIEVIANQKTILLKEVHHRVKNNLQLVSGLLYLQSVKHKNPDVTAMVDESQKHINSIALVHEMLYQDESMSMVFMHKYVKELGLRLLQVSPQDNIVFDLQVEEVSLPIDYATTLGLLINELITNSMKYAFSSDSGIIKVTLIEVHANEYLFTYADNGVGFDFDNQVSNNQTLGKKLIKMLAEEIGAELIVNNQEGLSYNFSFNTKE